MNFKKALPYIAGAAPGIALGTMGIFQIIPSEKKLSLSIKKDLVNAREMVKKYAPNARIATNRREFDSKLKNFIVGKDVSEKINSIFRGINAGQIPAANIIVSPPMVNRSLIGHEIGHHINTFKKHKPDSVLQSSMERNAWASSPFQDKASKEMSRNAVGTYTGTEKLMAGIVALPIGLTIAHILKRK